MIYKKSLVRRDVIFGSCYFVNYFFRRVLVFGGLFFFIIGFFSKKPVIFNDIVKYVQFFPQGIVICFYGAVRILLGNYLVLSGYWIVGKGFNEYDRKEKRICVFRWGFPGENRCFNFFCSFSDVKSLCRENPSSRVSPKLYLILKEDRKIFLTQLGSIEFRSSREVEYFSANLARFLIIPLKDKTVV